MTGEVSGFACIAGRFGRVEPRRRAWAYLLGLLADVETRSCWQLAEHAGDDSPHGMQRLLSEAVWDADAVRDDLRRYMADQFTPYADAPSRASLEVLTRTRADALAAHGAELRRTERYLHDGTRARLVAIAMRRQPADRLRSTPTRLALGRHRRPPHVHRVMGRFRCGLRPRRGWNPYVGRSLR